MRRGLNKVMIIGHLGRDPELRYTASGQVIVTFPVVTTRYWNTASGERRSETEWFQVVAWGNLAEICKQFLSKGERVYIEGRLKTRRWEDAQGNRRYSVEIVANEMIVLSDRRRRRFSREQESDAQAATQASDASFAEDLVAPQDGEDQDDLDYLEEPPASTTSDDDATWIREDDGNTA